MRTSVSEVFSPKPFQRSANGSNSRETCGLQCLVPNRSIKATHQLYPTVQNMLPPRYTSSWSAKLKQAPDCQNHDNIHVINCTVCHVDNVNKPATQ